MEILTPEVSKGLRNDLKATLDKIDEQYLNGIVGGQEAGEDDTQNDLKVHEENTTIEELEALGESLGKGDDHQDMDIITEFLKFLLGVWAETQRGLREVQRVGQTEQCCPQADRVLHQTAFQKAPEEESSC